MLQSSSKVSGLKASGSQTDKDHCSAFIATGSATRDGRVVMDHNSWNVYEQGQFLNLILDLEPSDGHHILMQSMPGYIHSMSDFFVSEAGIMGTETTIGGFGQYEPDETPEFLRVRKAMQYADDLDEFIKMMEKITMEAMPTVGCWLMPIREKSCAWSLDSNTRTSSARWMVTSSATTLQWTPGFATSNAAIQVISISECLQELVECV